MDTEQQKQELSPPGDEGWTLQDAALGIIVFLVIAGVAVGAYFFYQSTRPEPLREGSLAPEFSLPLLKGGEAKLSDYGGKVVLLNIWATWCNPCREEMPSMEKLYQKYKGQPFEILAASVDARAEVDVEPFVKKLNLTFPILLDPSKKISDLYQTTGFPESFIIDKKGRVVKRIIGPLQWDDPQVPEVQLIQHLIQSS